MTPTPLELAEDFASYLPPRPQFLRVETPGYVLNTGNSGASVVHIRLGDGDVESTVAEIRARVAGEDVDRIEWWCGTLSTPADLPARLEALGLVPDEDAPTLAALVLDRPPTGVPTADVRRVETYEDFVTAMEIDVEGWAMKQREIERRRKSYRETWETLHLQGAQHYLGYLDGEPVAQARAFFLDDAVLLLGGATRPAFRGKGVYVSLVHARWRDAVERDTPRLVVQAGPMSRPILQRMGFEQLGEIELLVDHVAT